MHAASARSQWYSELNPCRQPTLARDMARVLSGPETTRIAWIPVICGVQMPRSASPVLVLEGARAGAAPSCRSCT